MSRLLEIMGGQQTAKQTQTGSRLMQIMDKYEQEQRKREVDAWRKQLASVPTPAPTKTVTTAQEALEAERIRREKGEPLAPFIMKKTMPEPLSMNLADSSTTAGYLANRAISGLASAAEGYESTRKLLQPKTDIPGLPPTQMKYQQQRLTEKRQQDRAETAEAGLGKSGLVRFAGDAIEAASQQIPNTLLGLASGGMGTAGQAAANVLPRVFGSTSMMAQIIGNTYTQATQNGASHKKALQYAAASGILETAVESLFSGMPGMGKGALDGLTDSLTKKIGSRFAKMLAEKGLDMFGEGVEEFVTAMIEPLVQKATIEPDKKIDWKQTAAEALYSFLVGAGTAGIMQAPGTVHQAYNINSINNQAKAAERIVNVTQDGKAWELLQQKPVTKMTVEEQVSFIEAIQEDLGIRETNEQTIETKGSRIVETKKAVEQAQVLQPAEQPTSEFKPQESAVENIPVSEEKTEAGQPQAVEQAEQVQESKQAVQNLVRGNTVKAYDNDNNEYEFVYAVASVDDLISSHDTDMDINLNYPQELQPRDRERVSSKAQVEKMAGNIRPELLGDNPKISDGAPIIGQDNIVESGNGRVIALKKMYQAAKDKGTNYKEWLKTNAAKFGLDANNLPENPVLVRVRLSEVDRNEFVKKANETSVALMSSTETAKSDSERMSDRILGLFVENEDGIINTAANRPFITTFTSEIIPGNELGKYITPEGYLSQDGLARVRNAIFYKAYGSDNLLTRISESTDNNIKNITNSLINIAPQIVAINKGIQKGSYFPIDYASDITAAVEKFVSLKNDKATVEEYLLQLTMLDDDMSASAKAIMYVVEQNSRSAKKLTEFFGTVFNAIEELGDPNQISLFGDKTSANKEDVLYYAYRRFEDNGQESFGTDIESQSRKGGEVESILRSQNGQERKTTQKPKQSPKPPETIKDVEQPAQPQPTTQAVQVEGMPEDVAARLDVYDLPDTEQELSDLINKMEEQQRQGIKIDLQLFGAAKTKLSKFRTNTMERTPKIDPQTKRVIESAEAFDPMLFGYTPETNEAWEAEARWDVEHFYEATKRRLENSDSIAGGVATWEFSLIAEKLRNESEKTGDRTEYIEWIQRAASVGREEGRGIQAIRMAWGLDKVDGAVMQVQKTVDEVNKDISDTDPQIKRDKRKIKNSVKKAQKDAGDGVARDIETLTPEELLAKRIQSHVKEVADAKADPIKDMVNELYRIAQESPLPDKDITKRDPMEFVAQAIKNREQYTEVFNKAKEIVEKKFKGNEDALALLDAYFNKEAIPVISKIRLNAAIKNVVRNLGTTIERIAKSGRQTKTEIFKALAGEFITKGNLEQDEAKYLVPFLVDAYDAQVKERAQTILSNMLKTKTKTKGVPFAERVKEIINMGVANEDAMNRVLSEKYNLPKLDNETIQEIMDIYDTVDSGKLKEIKELIVKESKLDGKKAEMLQKELDKIETSRYKAIAMGVVIKRFTDRQQATVWRKLSTLQAMKHLLNFVTPSRNRVSNSAMARLEKVSETISSTMWGKYTKAGLRYSDTAKVKAKAEAQHEKVDVMLGIRSRGRERTKYDTYKGHTFKKGLLGKAERLMTKTLRVNDVYNSELRKQDALENMTALNGGYVTKEIRTESEYEGRFATFNDDSLPARVLSGIGRVLSTVGMGKSKGLLAPADFSLKDLVIKYSRVPGNIIARTLEYSPAGYLKSIYGFYQASRSAGNEFTMKRRAALAFGRATTGTGLMALGALMYSLGLFIQRKPDEEKGEAALSRAMGLNQGQVNISALGRVITGGKAEPKDGDLLVSISAFEPFATTITAGASIKQSIDEGKTFGESANIATENTFDEMLDMPTMAIIQAMWQESQREGSNFWTVATVPAVKAIPGFISQPTRATAKALDPVARSTSGKTVYERTLKETMRNLPLVSTLLEPQVDPTGEQYKNLTGEPATSLINYLLNPGYATIYKNIPYKDKLRTLSQAFPDSNLWPRYYAIDGVGDKKLTDKEKTVYMEAFGQYYNKAFENKLKNINVNKLSSTKKQDLIKQLEALRSDALKKGREAVVSYRKKK